MSFHGDILINRYTFMWSMLLHVRLKFCQTIQTSAPIWSFQHCCHIIILLWCCAIILNFTYWAIEYSVHYVTICEVTWYDQLLIFFWEGETSLNKTLILVLCCLFHLVTKTGTFETAFFIYTCNLLILYLFQLLMFLALCQNCIILCVPC